MPKSDPCDRFSENITSGAIVTNNDVLRSIQQVLGISASTIADIFKLAGYQIDIETVSCLLKDDDETGFALCNDNQLKQFLNGLITYRRGKSEHNASQTETDLQPLTNNIIFKKIRIAFELQESDLIEIMSHAGYEVTKNELSTISRKFGHKHYRECGNEFLMALLIGLSYRQWS